MNITVVALRDSILLGRVGSEHTNVRSVRGMNLHVDAFDA